MIASIKSSVLIQNAAYMNFKLEMYVVDTSKYWYWDIHKRLNKLDYMMETVKYLEKFEVNRIKQFVKPKQNEM